MRGAFGARKNPTKLANRIGVNGAKLVSFVKSNVVLTGVRVTAALSAAIVQIMARAGLSPGIKTAIALPIQAPVKNNGMIKPPRQPPVTVRHQWGFGPSTASGGDTPFSRHSSHR